MSHISFIHSSVDGHLGYFHVLAIVNNTTMNIGMHISYQGVMEINYNIGVDIYSLLLLLFSCSVMSNSLRPLGLQHACQASLSLAISWSLLKLMPIESRMPSNHLTLCQSPSPLAFSLSWHQGLFHWVSSSHVVAKVLELQFQHHSFSWIFRTDFL